MPGVRGNDYGGRQAAGGRGRTERRHTSYESLWRTGRETRDLASDGERDI